MVIAFASHADFHISCNIHLFRWNGGGVHDVGVDVNTLITILNRTSLTESKTIVFSNQFLALRTKLRQACSGNGAIDVSDVD